MKPATGSRPATLTHVKKDEDREKKEATPMCMGFIPTKEDVVGPCGKWAKGSIMFEQKVGTMSIKMCIYFKKSDAKCPPGGKVGDKPDDNKNMCTLLLTPTKKWAKSVKPVAGTKPVKWGGNKSRNDVFSEK